MKKSRVMGTVVVELSLQIDVEKVVQTALSGGEAVGFAREMAIQKALDALTLYAESLDLRLSMDDFYWDEPCEVEEITE